MGSARARAFTGAVSMALKSMLPHTLFVVACMATLEANSPVSILFLRSLYVMFAVRAAYPSPALRTTTDGCLSCGQCLSPR